MAFSRHIAVLIASGVIAACSASAPPPSPAPAEPSAVSGDDRRAARNAWFIRQRLYPFHSLGEDVRAKAFREMRRMEEAGGLKAATDAFEHPYQWVPAGPAPTESRFFENWQYTTGRIRSVVISPADPSVVLIGTSSGGIWRSADGGDTFVPVTDDQFDLSVASIAFAPSEPSIVYAGMGGEFLGSGVLKSTDAGLTWARIDEAGLPPMAMTVRIAVDPRDAGVVLLAQSWKLADGGDLEPSYVYQSADGGRTWEPRLGDFPADLIFDPVVPSMAYAAFPTRGAEIPPRIYRSLDSGTTWSVVFELPVQPGRFVTPRIAASAAKAGRVYVYASGASGTFLFVSDDHGATWREQETTGVSSRALLLEATPEDADIIYMGQYVDLFRSSDGGATWTNLTQVRDAGGRPQYGLSRTHPDQFSMAFIPGTGEFLLGNDGGLYRSEEGGTRFVHRNDTLSLTQVYGITAHPRVRGMLFIGTQDNGLQIRRPDDGGWKEFSTGDYGKPWIDPTRDDRVCANYYFSIIYCYTEYGALFDRVAADGRTFSPDNEEGRIGFLAPFVGTADSTLYFGTFRLWTINRLPHVDEKWTAPAGELDLTRGGFDVLTEIAAAPSDPEVLYTGSAEGRVMRSADRGVTWTDVSPGLPERFVTSIVVSRSDPNRLWITLSGFRASHVFASDDGGTTWKDLQANLPDIPVNVIWVEPSDESDLLVGTDIGVFRSLDGGSSWTPFNRGLPPVIVHDFAAGADGSFYAGTHGRGVYALSVEGGRRRRAVGR